MELRVHCSDGTTIVCDVFPENADRIERLLGGDTRGAVGLRTRTGERVWLVPSDVQAVWCPERPRATHSRLSPS